jgi:hypothetical protein
MDAEKKRPVNRHGPTPEQLLSLDAITIAELDAADPDWRAKPLDVEWLVRQAVRRGE